MNNLFSARSIASKGKSDVKESTDSSTTLEDEDKGMCKFVLTNFCIGIFSIDFFLFLYIHFNLYFNFFNLFKNWLIIYCIIMHYLLF